MVDPTLVGGVAAMLQGNPAPSRPLNRAMLIYGGIMALVVLQLIGIAWSALVLQRWWQQPAHRPRGAWRSRFWHLGRPVGLPLLVAALFLGGLPKV